MGKKQKKKKKKKRRTDGTYNLDAVTRHRLESRTAGGGRGEWR